MKINNFENVKKFTDSLFEMMKIQNMSLVKSLEAIEETEIHGKGNIISKVASFTKNRLQEGENLSSIMRVCPYLEFDSLYISFISFSEKTGNLLKSLEFLKSRCSREKENREKIIEAIIYPCFVIFLALAFSIFIVLYKNILFSATTTVASSDNEIGIIVKSFLLLILFSFFGFLSLKKLICNSNLYEAFLIINFQINEEVDICSAINCVIELFGCDSKYGLYFEMIKERIEYGLDFRKAFFIDKTLIRNSKIRSEINNAFYLADKMESKSEVFDKIATWIFERNEARRKCYMKLIEPVCIVVVGIFLLSIVISLYMPSLSILNT